MTKPNLNKSNAFTLTTAFCAVVLALLVCFFLRNSAIGCHDSFADMMYARENSLFDCYKLCLEFNLARGRVGFLFSLVSTIRFAILKTGNVTAIWLLQQVPTWLTVGLIAWMIGRKTKAVYGMYFACFFAACVQIDTNHNLMVCYPLDFVYGIAVMAVGFYLYDSYITHKGEKRNVLRLVFSVFCYYESMLCYEPFIVTCIAYGLISLFHAYANREHLGKKAFGTFVKDLIPHAVATLIYFVILQWVKAHPIVNTVDVTPIDDYGTLHDFLETWYVFATGIFPFTSDKMVDVPDSIAHVFDSTYNAVFSLVAAAAVISFAFASKYIYLPLSKEDKKRMNSTLLAIGTVGFVYALFFTVPHALTLNYQNWVEVLEATGYLTSSMCYFGWAVAFACFVSAGINKISEISNKWIYYVTVLVIAFGAFVGAEITVNVNNNYAKADMASGIQMSYRGQVFYAFVSSDYAQNASDLLYVPDYSGIHDDLKITDEYADFEMGRDVFLERNSDAVNFLANYYGTVGFLDYQTEPDAGFYVLLDNPLEPRENWVCSGDLLVVSARPGTYTVSFTDAVTGEACAYSVDLGRCDTAVLNEGNVIQVSSLTISYN